MNLFEPSSVEEVLFRLNKLTAATPAQWGQMNAAQMMAHCQASFQTFFGELRLKRVWIGYLFGRMAKKKLFSSQPWARNLPTAPQFRIRNERNFDVERQKLVAYINRFASEGYTITSTVHPFFGKLSSQEWAVFAYRHLDHHLKQFGV